jgi:hypothetical protein
MTEQRFQRYLQLLRVRLDKHAVCCGDRLSWQLLDRAVAGRASFADRAVILTMAPDDPDYVKRTARAARRIFAQRELTP